MWSLQLHQVASSDDHNHTIDSLLLAHPKYRLGCKLRLNRLVSSDEIQRHRPQDCQRSESTGATCGAREKEQLRDGV